MQKFQNEWKIIVIARFFVFLITRYKYREKKKGNKFKPKPCKSKKNTEKRR